MRPQERVKPVRIFSVTFLVLLFLLVAAEFVFLVFILLELAVGTRELGKKEGGRGVIVVEEIEAFLKW